jgi:UDP-N-acetylmuramate dehydrogenase
VNRPIGTILREGVPLAPLTTLGVGGPARYYGRAVSRREVLELVSWAEDRRLPLLVLGGGSNLVVADAGFPGLVLHVALEGLAWSHEGRDVEVRVGAGENWDGLVAEAVGRGLAGVECLSGIPGAVGATPIQNVGAYGQDVAETIKAVEALDLGSGTEVRFSAEDCEFGYRDSRFKRSDAGRFIVLSVTYRLEPGGAPKVLYADLTRHFDDVGISRPTLAEVRDAVLEIRRRKSMVLDAADPNARSAGSFFVNPVLSRGDFAALRATVDALGLGPLPHFAAPDGRVKVPAAWLIERSGFAKGYARGRAAISSRHALALVNAGGATASEIVDLAVEIRDGVAARFGVSLRPEPVFVGLTLDANAS